MEKLVLDFSKWRSGHYSSNQTGSGDTLLINANGFMCCLGQFAPQMDKNIKIQHLQGCTTPGATGLVINKLSDAPDPGMTRSTELSRRAVEINDDINTTPDEKITALKELFANNGYEIEVINKP